jgi:SAM-dependent methyltransferase/Fe-S-cluster containining protein
VTSKSVYTESYVPHYRRLYVLDDHWRAKHEHNLATIEALLPEGGSWLDVFCGQAWHFSRVSKAAERVGVDASAAQLALAREHNPEATFFEADVRDFEPDRRFDLVTAFWGGYSYLDDLDAIAAVITKLVRWTAPGGHLYLELIDPETLSAFNATRFADRERCEVSFRSPDRVRWSYRDPGGEHHLSSPPLELFEPLLTPHFEAIDSATAITAIRQVVATNRLEREIGAPAASPPGAADRGAIGVEDFEGGIRFVHAMEMQTKLDLEEIEAKLDALIDLLTGRGGISRDDLESYLESSRKRSRQRSLAELHVGVGPSVDKYALGPLPDIDCAALLHLCQARCCSLNFPLSFQDLDEGVVRWNYERPYQIRQRGDGYCSHSDPETRRCAVYDHRPATCRLYDCRNDKRIWDDFENRIPASPEAADEKG